MSYTTEKLNTGEVVEYSYDTHETTRHTRLNEGRQECESDMDIDCSQIPGHERPYVTEWTVKSIQETMTPFLKEIKTKYEKLGFTFTDRSDLVGGKKLDEIRVIPINGTTPFRKWKFTYEETISDDTPDISADLTSFKELTGIDITIADDYSNIEQALRRRIFLRTVQQIGADGSTLSPTQFEYNLPNELPSKYSTEQDHWGFFCANGSKSMIPQLFVYPTANENYNRFRNYPMSPTLVNSSNPEIHLAGANRSVNSTTIKYGSLEKVTYSGGGGLELTLEPNTYWDEFALQDIKGGGLRVAQVAMDDGLGLVVNRVFSYNSASNHSSGVLARKPNYATEMGWWRSEDPNDPLYNEQLKYALYIFNPDQNPSFHYTNTIQSIINTWTEEQKWDRFTWRYANSYSGLSNQSGLQVGYTQVTIQDLKGNNSFNGKTVKTYHPPKDFKHFATTVSTSKGLWVPGETGPEIDNRNTRDMEDVANNPNITVQNFAKGFAKTSGTNIFPYPPLTDVLTLENFSAGKLASEKVYDETDLNTPIKSVEYEYKLFSLNDTPEIVYGLSFQQHNASIKFDFLTSKKPYAYGRYQYITNTSAVIDKVTTSIDGVTSIVNYTYDPQKRHPFAISNATTNSDGKTHESRLVLPHEANETNLLAFNMVGIPLETKKYVDNTFQGSTKVLFHDFDGIYLPQYYQEILKNQTIVDRVSVGGYNQDGLPTAMTRMDFPETKYYWTDGLLTSTEQGIFKKSHTYYPDLRLLKSFTDVDGLVANFSYDQYQRLSVTDSRDGNIQVSVDYSKAYDLVETPNAADNRIKTTIQYSDAPTQTTVETFDGLGRPQKNLLNGVVKNEIIYDKLGRVQYQTYLPGNFTLFEYDNSPLNRVLKETYPDGTFSTMAYAAEGNYFKTTTTDENGNTSNTLTDILGRPYKIINALGDETVYEYGDDRTNSPTKIIPPMGDDVKFTYHYTFDERNRLATRTLPQGGTTTNTYYDATDLLESTTDANGNVLTFNYDIYGRETAKQLAGTTISTSTYDVGGGINIGKMTQSEVWKLGSNTSYTTDYEYDDFGRTKKMTAQNHIGGTDITDYTYNHADWQLTALRQHTGYENLSVGMGYEYDGFGRITKTIQSLNGQAQLLAQNAWNNRDQLVRKVLGNGLQKIDYEYNNRGWLTRINQPFDYTDPFATCDGNGGEGPSSLTDEELLILLDADIYCGQANEDLNYIIQNRFDLPAFNVDCYNPCENTGSLNSEPECTPSEASNQLNSVTAARDKMKTTYTTTEQRTCADGSIETFYKPDASTMNLPNKLYRLRLCDGSQAYVFEDELALITGTYYLIQEENIQHVNQTFSIKDAQGIQRYVQLAELINQVATGKNIYVNNFQPNQNPCSPQDFGCSLAEQTQNEDIIGNLIDNNGSFSAQTLTYPTNLYRVRLCGVGEYYLFPDELALFPDNFAILQTIQLTDANQRFMVGNTFDYSDGDDLFFLELHYDESQTDVDATAQKNGNIAFMDWQVSGNIAQSYGFQYDALDRIKGAKHSIGNYNADNRFSVSGINYDKNGNIQSIVRNTGASVAEGCFNVIDDLVYGYNGNQLTSMVDNAPSATKDLGFKSNGSGTYTYDNNGNMRFDPSRFAIFDLYNHLNLPTSYVKYGEGYLEWDYDANGTKLQKRTFGNTSIAPNNLPSQNNFAAATADETRDYVNGIEYVNNQLEAIYHNEGRIVKKNGKFEWQWCLKDHLGNTRVLFADQDNDGAIDAANELLSVKNYYPFGMEWSGNTDDTPKNAYGYNGKELDTDFGLNMHFYGARLYDSALGRFTGVDPISDEFAWVSTYNYAENEPVASIDLHGLQRVKVTSSGAPKVGSPGQANVSINLDYQIVSSGKGAVSNANTLSLSGLSNAFSRGNTTLFSTNLPSKTSNLNLLSGKAARWAEQAANGRNAKIRSKNANKLAQSGIQYYNIDVTYDYNFSLSPSLSSATTWMQADKQGRGVVFEAFPNSLAAKGDDVTMLAINRAANNAIARDPNVGALSSNEQVFSILDNYIGLNPNPSSAMTGLFHKLCQKLKNTNKS